MKKRTKQNQVTGISEKKSDENNPAKIEVEHRESVIKILESSKDENLLVELPVEYQNKSIICEDINTEQTIGATQLKTTVIQRDMELEEFVQNAEIKRIKIDQSDLKRRRSLRNETAAAIKKKPPKYEEIFNCYRRKEYKECIIYIDLVAESAKDWTEYQILKAACLIHLGIKLAEAHKILDDILKVNNTNPFSFYAKGLAYYRQELWIDSIQYFEKAISLDKSSMQRAEVMLKLAKEELEKMDKKDEQGCILSNEIKIEPIEEQDDPDSYESNEFDMNDSKPNIDRKDRFKCEICNKSFCKKFNLDRHNKIMHNRETPFIPPLARNYNNRRSAPEPITIKIEEKSESPSESPVTSKSSQFKIRLGRKIKRTQSMSSLAVKSEMGRCKICKKLYRKGSLARHEVIHSGNFNYILFIK